MAQLSTEQDLGTGVVVSTSVITGHKCILINMPPKDQPLPPRPPQPDYSDLRARSEQMMQSAKEEGEASD